MIKILFVCHGNICRSPMAEFVAEKIIKDKNLSSDFFVSSCAVSTEEIRGGVGNHIYPPAQRELLKHGIEFDKEKRAVQLRAKDYDEYDYIIAMDNSNIKNIFRIIGDDKLKKVHKLMDFTMRKGDISDPWYSGDFEKAYNDIYEGCKCLIEYIEKENL